MNEQLESPISSEQKLAILRNEMATPLAIILGHASLMKKHFELNSTKSEEIMDWVSAIIKAADQLEKLRDELL